MTTTLLTAMQELSRQLGDSWSSVTDGAGAATSLVDSALMSKANDWVTDNSWAFLIEEPASAAAIYDERKISSLDNTTGTLTTLTFAAAPGTGIDYEVHRLFSPSDKRTALVAAARRIYPHLFTEVWDETLVSGNWFKDGSFEKWTSSSALSFWTAATVTLTQTTGAGYFRHGTTSCKLSGASGTLIQRWIAGTANFDDLKELRGKSVTFTLAAWCDTASSLRISIADGTDTTYSSYHAGNSAWTDVASPMKVSQAISSTATGVTFTIHYTTGAIAYVDDARAIGGLRTRLYIGHLGLSQNRPHQVAVETGSQQQLVTGNNTSIQNDRWVTARDWLVDPDGYLHLPTSYPTNYRLRIRGIGYLDFLVSGASSTAWTATIALDQPQLEILIAQAAMYLYTTMSLPNFETGTRKQFQEAMGFWAQELAERKARYSMLTPAATVHWGVN